MNLSKTSCAGVTSYGPTDHNPSKPPGHLRLASKLIHVCQSWQQGVLNGMLRVRSVAQANLRDSMKAWRVMSN